MIHGRASAWRFGDRRKGPVAKGKSVSGRRTGDEAKSGATVGYEAQLWQMADALRGSMDAAEYKHVCLGLLFLKYISDAFDERHAYLERAVNDSKDDYYLAPSTRNRSDAATKLLEDPDEYRSQSIFWVPPEARWPHLKAQARQSTIGQLVDDAMAGIERDNPALKGVLPKDYARPALDKQRLGQLIDLISNIQIGDEASRAKDVLGRVYEYFLSQFASAEGKKGGEFYTPRCVVKLLVEMIEPYRGRVYDPCCGSSGMFVQSVEFIRAHAKGNGNGWKAKADISIYGQESNYTTWRLAKMNLAIRGIDGQIAHGDTFHNDRHPDLKADFILANPPFNISDWGGERLRDDKRWKYGAPPAGNANFAWVQHIVHHLAPAGVAGFVLANGSMSSNQSGEGEIRKSLIEADIVDCMVALPGQLFYSTQIPACLWFLARDRKNGKFRDRRGHVLFIDARKLGRMADRTHRELTDEDVTRIATTYHAWRGEKDAGAYADIAGFCKSAPIDEVRKHGHVLTPGRYVGAEAQEDDGEPFDEKMKRLSATLREQQDEGAKLDAAIAANLKELGYGG
ncbi:MAG: SAM-dependent DNA methyltransferase [Planctomycetes bacterium]|nr:SAM-dependent DNA methyltransferase [Planctomycetota bacterium]